MGKAADVVPTTATVGAAIAKLKPEKRRAWKIRAERMGWPFEQFVIEKLRQNIDHRQWWWRQKEPARECGGTLVDVCAQEGGRSLDGKSRIAQHGSVFEDEQGGTPLPAGLALYCTQKLELELASRKRKRDCADDVGVLAAQQSTQTPQSHQERHSDRHSCNKHSVQNGGDRVLESPVGSSTATQNEFPLTTNTSFVTAEERHSLVSPNRSPLTSPPLSPLSFATQQDNPRVEAPDDHPDSFMDLPTQDWRDFLESSQAAPAANSLARNCQTCGAVLGFGIDRICFPCCPGPQVEADIEHCCQGFTLSEQQGQALRYAARGKNVFLTGSAGTGKTQVLLAMVQFFKMHSKRVDVLATTGMVAMSVGGKTIHAYAGWGLKAQEYLLPRLEKNARKRKNFWRLSATDILIIDEISMVSNNTLTRLDRIMKAARHDNRPFGGALIVAVGDFFQLGPIKPFETCLYCGGRTKPSASTSDETICEEHGRFHDDDKWAFRSDVWEKCRFEYVNLHDKFRQADPLFSRMLDKIRVGVPLSVDEDDLLRSCRAVDLPDDTIRLYPRRRAVDRENNDMFHKLAGQEFGYVSIDDYHWNKHLHPDLKRSWTRVEPGHSHSQFAAYSNEENERHRFDHVLMLKKCMPVLLLKNIDVDKGLANGTKGHIVGFMPFEEAPSPRKRQHGDDPTSGEWLIYGDHIQHQQKAVQEFVDRAVDRVFPIVCFENGMVLTVFPHCAIEELGSVKPDGTQEEFSLRSRTQIPLAPGWAISIHKSQGMTLSSALVDLGSVFEPGMAYVALSRLKGLDGLTIESLAYGKATRASEIVKAFASRHDLIEYANP